MARHPYLDLPDSSFWRRAVGDAAGAALDPVTAVPFRLGRRDRVMTAGSCFAQHIGRYLKAAGCAYLVTEPAHPLASAEAVRLTNYGLFTARYGNVYTARQLLQLFERAYGRLEPAEDIWSESERVFLDPFRPSIQPRGFNSRKEFDIDRERHFRAVREAFETLDVLVFTLGLTEAWRARPDGAVFPVCPGVMGGAFSPERHEFVNFGVEETVADLKTFVTGLRAINPGARIILTVSPVPLAATAEPRHVLVSTVYSKSVLRVAADMVARAFENVAYFPAYEIVAGGFAGDYFAEDRRSVTEQGVAHVMRVFADHFLNHSGSGSSGVASMVRRAVDAVTLGPPLSRDARIAGLEAALQTICDEEALAAHLIEPDAGARS